MKKLQSTLFALAGCLAFVSCSDDDNGGGNNVSADLTGTYELTAAVASEARDYDNDGDASTNLALEGNCYNDSWISFHSDGTYEEGFSHSTAANGGTEIECETSITSGTWTQDGSEVTTTSSSNVTATYNFNSSAHTLTRTDNDGEFVGWNSASRIWANLTGNLQLKFEKYTDDDDDNGNGQDDDSNIDADANIFSNFGLTAFIVSEAQDLDNDGNSSTNLATETNCYANSTITFNTDGTYERDYSYSVLNLSNLSLECDSMTESGTYTRIGDTIFTRNSSGSITGSFDLAANGMLSGTWEDAEYPGRNSVTDLFVSLTGDVDLKFERESASN